MPKTTQRPTSPRPPTFPAHHDQGVEVWSSRAGRWLVLVAIGALFHGCDDARTAYNGKDAGGGSGGAQQMRTGGAGGGQPATTGGAGGGSGGRAAPSDGGAPDAVIMDGGPNPAVVWPADATKVVAVNHGGGFGIQPPPGAACPAQGEGTTTLTVANKKLTWHICQAFTAPSYTYRDGTRTLTAAEFATVVSALQMVTPTTRTICGADKGLLSLKVTTPAGEKEYLDSFYVCSKMGVYVDNIDGVFSTLQAFTN